MTDIADRAEEIERAEREEALARHAERAATHEQPFAIEGRRVCLDCFDPLSRKRLKANPHAVRCVECQNDLYRRKKRGIA